MERFRFLLPSGVAMALLLSLFFVNGSFAEPLGAGLLQRFGVSSGGSSGSTQSAPRLDLPVTVTNPSSMPVPVTVQGTTNQPLTATINGTVNTNATVNGTVNTNATVQGTVSTVQENVPGSQPFQAEVEFAIGTNRSQSQTIAVPSDKILVIRYVSGYQEVDVNELVNYLNVQMISGNSALAHLIVPGQVVADAPIKHYDYGAETWLEADPGTTITVSVGRNGTANMGSDLSGIFLISGYLIDAPTTPIP